MSLGFLSPLFLIGLAGALVPILIHRLTQRRPVTKKFSAVRLLLRAQQRVSRPHQIKNWLLLALRISAIAILSTMLARPLIVTRGPLAVAGAGPASVVLIMDNSFSMAYRTVTGTRFSIAKELATILVGDLGPADRVAVIAAVPAGDRKEDGAPEFLNPALAVKVIAGIDQSFQSADYSAALRSAYQFLKGARYQKRIILISDMARGGWEGLDTNPMGGIDPEVEVKVVRLGGPARDQNLSVSRVELAEGYMAVGVPVRLSATVSNYSQEGQAGIVAQLYIQGRKVDQRTISLKGMGENRVEFEIIPDRSGWLEGEVKIPGDQLTEDDVRRFAAPIWGKMDVLVVDGDPKTSLKESETFFLVNALNPEARGESSLIVPRVIVPDEMSTLDFSRYLAIFLCNVGELPQGVAGRLADYVRSGKTLVLFVGDRIDPVTYNSSLYDSGLRLLPARLRDLVQADGAPFRLSRIDLDHEAMRGFSGPRAAGLLTAAFSKYLRLEGGQRPTGHRSLLSFANGDPLLIESPVGRGKVLLFTSTSDLEWNDLGLKPGFLPLIQSLMIYLANNANKSAGLTMEAGAVPPWPPGFSRVPLVRLISPGGVEAILPRERAESYRAELPGIYRAHGEGEEFRFAVNPAGGESDLGKMTSRELKNKLPGVPVTIVDYRSKEDLAALEGNRQDLWPPLLLLLMGIVAAEMWLANRQAGT